MFCPKCGSQAIDGAGFCQKCGTKLIAGESTAQPAATASSAKQTRRPGNTPVDVPRKKKSKKLPIILIVIGLVLAVILIVANSDDLEERGVQAQKDEEYIKSHQTNVQSETPATLDTSDKF